MALDEIVNIEHLLVGTNFHRKENRTPGYVPRVPFLFVTLFNAGSVFWLYPAVRTCCDIRIEMSTKFKPQKNQTGQSPDIAP